jgi:hypothetical protein
MYMFIKDEGVLFLRVVIYTLIIFTSSFYMNVVQAHTNGASVEQEVGDYFIDIGYAPETIVAGEPIRFDFAISDLDSLDGTEFSDIWVQVEKERETFFAGGIHRAEFGTTGFLFIFPLEGLYTVHARFQNSGKEIVQTSFQVEVAEGMVVESHIDSPLTGILIGAIGLVFGALVGWRLARRRRESENVKTYG